MSDLPELELSCQDHGRADTLRFKTGPVVLGRMDECDFVVSDAKASRRHATVERNGEAWILRDLGSINGTFINGRQIETPHEIADGDVIQLGGSVVRCRLHGHPGPVPASVVQPVVDPAEDSAKRVSKTVRVGDIGDIVNSVFGANLETLPVRGGPPVFGSSTSQQAAELTRIVGVAADVLIGSADLETTLHYILDLVFDNLPVDRGYLLLLDEKGVLVPGAQRARPGVSPDQARISQRIAETALQSRKAALIENAEAIRAASPEVESAMCAPLCRSGRVCGLLYVDRKSAEGPFGKLHLDVLSIIASISGAAVERAQQADGGGGLRERMSRHVRGEAIDAAVNGHGDGRIAPERREVSVLACAVDGLDATLTSSSPPDGALQVDELLEGLSKAVFDEGGTLDRFAGAGLVAIFGAPTVQTDHAARAVRAALSMQRWLRERTNPNGGPALELYVGVESGPALVGDVGTNDRLEYTAIGAAPDAAGDLQSAVAEAGQVIVGAGTYRLVKSLFDCEALPPTALARRREPGQAWWVRGER